MDSFAILCKSIAVFIYGSISILSIIFTFSIDTYNRLEGLLNLKYLFPKIIINPLEKNVDFVNSWLIAHNKIIGPLLVFLSCLDIFILFRVIDLL